MFNICTAARKLQLTHKAQTTFATFVTFNF